MVTVKAHAKINLTLDVTGTAENGYHTLSMLMQSVSLADTLTLSKAAEGIRIFTRSTRVPVNENNLVYKAARLFLDEASIESGVSIDLRKCIPVAAGLGGGSADAAATLYGLNELFETRMSRKELCDLGFRLGSDIPFCLTGGTALCEGFGEIITPLPPIPDCYILIAKPLRGMSTAKAYALYDTFSGELPEINTADAVNAAMNVDLDALCSHINNRLQPVTESEVSAVRKFTLRMLECGAKAACMSGSGTAVFGIFESRILADRCKKRFGHGAISYICSPSPRGVEIK